MRVILTGGGTGGHIYPALAIGQAVRKEWPEADFLYVGTTGGLENRIVPQAGFPFASIDVVGWQRKISLQAATAVYKAISGFFQARKIIKEFSPRIVIGTGGYVCLPVVWAAARLGIPTVIHEQNALPGLTNKFLARRVDRILLTFPESSRHFPSASRDRLCITGLPVRPSILQITKEEGLKFFGLKAQNPTLLVVGGSRGAMSINKAMAGVYKELEGSTAQIIHLTGQGGYSQTKASLLAEGIDVVNCGNIIFRPYLHEMEYALACADLCVGRAGAAFLAEITAKGLPSILIPYPWAAENHQEHNARALAQLGAAELIPDDKLAGKELARRVKEILFNPKKRQDMANRSLQAGKPEAIEKILQVIKDVISDKRKR